MNKMKEKQAKEEAEKSKPDTLIEEIDEPEEIVFEDTSNDKANKLGFVPMLDITADMASIQNEIRESIAKIASIMVS